MVHPTTTNNNNSSRSAMRSSTDSTASRKRAHSSSVEFSQEISIMERKATIESQEVIESGKCLLLVGAPLCQYNISRGLYLFLYLL